MADVKVNHPNCYAKLTLGYGATYVLPWTDASIILEKMIEAEEMSGSAYDNSFKIKTIERLPSIELLSVEQYKKIKMESFMDPTETDD